MCFLLSLDFFDVLHVFILLHNQVSEMNKVIIDFNQEPEIILLLKIMWYLSL